MTKRQKKNAADNLIQQLYSKYFNCIQINMMDIPKVWKDIEAVSTLSGDELDQKMQALVAKWRLN